ncbi:MAG: Holliday junction branch migration protein RuvA [Clostridiales Family XIII bacterium]|jgi:Holliday junction DNA helicase RuvA|nr:Holliday junction branch migration protein RuvA [Clostridiales Family XIII bacterium]
MIAYIAGTLLEKFEASVVVDTGGVGYEVFLPSSSRVFLRAKGDEVVLQTTQIFKEDDVSLYGFEDRASLKLFKMLITVSGVGAKAAIAILSALSTDEAVRAIAFSDAAMLTRANGVGKKSAERIVLELKDKVTEAFAGGGAGVAGSGGRQDGTPTGAGSASGENGGDGVAADVDIAGEAIEVLLELGYSRSEAGPAVLRVCGEAVGVEDCVKLALKQM